MTHYCLGYDEHFNKKREKQLLIQLATQTNLINVHTHFQFLSPQKQLLFSLKTRPTIK